MAIDLLKKINFGSVLALYLNLACIFVEIALNTISHVGSNSFVATLVEIRDDVFNSRRKTQQSLSLVEQPVNYDLKHEK